MITKGIGNSIYKILSVIVVLFTVLMSKTYYFGVQQYNITRYIYYVAVLFLILTNGISLEKLNRNAPIIIALLFVLSINLICYFPDMNSNEINQVINYMILIIFAGMTAISMPASQFANLYVKIIDLICIISIPCFLIANTNVNLAYKLCQHGYRWPVTVGYSPYYTWGINGVISTRNAGPFWEAGAFQGFIILAILMLLYKVDNDSIKHPKLSFLILTITLLTTQSSTGYILLIIIFLTQWKKIALLFNLNNSLTRNLMVLFIFAISIYIIIHSKNISNKFTNATTNSFAIRSSDITGGLRMILHGGFLGFGETIQRDSFRILEGVNPDDSVGLFAMIYTFGWIFGCFYLFAMFNGIRNFFHISLLKDYIFLAIVFLVLHLTEGLWFLPVYLTVIFFEEEKTPCLDAHSKANKNDVEKSIKFVSKYIK